MLLLILPKQKYSRYLKKHPQVVAEWLVRWRVIQMLAEPDSLRATLRYALTQPPKLQQAARQGLMRVKPRLIEPLFQFASGNNEDLAQIARYTLEHLALPESRHFVCQKALSKSSLALEIALKADYYPQESHERALFFFLTNQLERYQNLDFDGRILRLNYELADAALRRRILEVARQAGRSDLLINVVSAQSSLDDKLGQVDMDESEWQDLCRALIENQQYEAMWRMAQVAPPAQSAKLIMELDTVYKQEQWQPTDSEEVALFQQLVRAAYPCQQFGPIPLGKDLIEPVELAEPDWAFAFFNISWDGRYLAACTKEGNLKLWSLPQGRELFKINLAKFPLQVLRETAKASPNRKWAKLQILAFQFTTSGEIICLFQCWAKAKDDEPRAGLVKFALDAHQSLTVIEQIQVPASIEADLAKTTTIAISPNGKIIAIGSLRLWNLPEFEVLWPHKHSDHYLIRRLRYSRIREVIFHPNNEDFVAIGSYYYGTQLSSLSRKSQTALSGDILAFNSNGKALVTSSGHSKIRLYCFPTEAKNSFKAVYEVNISAETYITALAINAEGNRAIGGDNSGNIRFYNLKKRREQFSINTGNAPIRRVALSPNNQLLFSLDAKGQLKLWTTKLIKLYQQPFFKTKPTDFIFVQEARQSLSLLPSEKFWLNFISVMLRWKFQHEIEIGEVGENFEVDFADFDIELADDDFENV